MTVGPFNKLLVITSLIISDSLLWKSPVLSKLSVNMANYVNLAVLLKSNTCQFLLAVSYRVMFSLFCLSRKMSQTLLEGTHLT